MASLTSLRHSRLLTLPLEVRQNIIKHIFQNASVSIVGREILGSSRETTESGHRCSTSIASDFSLEITQTCQQLRTESLHIATSSVKLSIKDVSLEQLRAVVPRSILQQATNVKFDVRCLHSSRDEWRPEDMPITFPALQVLYIHTVIAWDWLNQKGDKESADIVRDPGLLYDRVAAHIAMCRQQTRWWHESIFHNLPGPETAQCVRLEVQVSKEYVSLPPLFIMHLEWPSLRLINCFVDNLYEFAHYPHQTRESAIRQTLRLGEGETTASS